LRINRLSVGLNYERNEKYIFLLISNLIPNKMEEQIIKVLQVANIPMKSGEIAEASGLDKKEVDKLIKKLKSEEKIDSPKRCYYSIKN
jgi:predicted transcriptional regulator